MTEITKAIQADDFTRPYKLRELNAGDERTVGAMIARVTGDARVNNAIASGDQNVIILAVVSALLEKVPREISLWCASLVGEDKEPKLKEYRKEERKEARDEGRLPAPEGEIRYWWEEEIIEKMDSYPSGTYLNILADVLSSPGFEGFLASSSRLGTAARIAFSRFSNLSGKNGTSPTES